MRWWLWMFAAAVLGAGVGCSGGWWSVKPETITGVELRRATCVCDQYYQTRKLPDGTPLDDAELNLRLQHNQHVRSSRSLAECDGVLP